MEERKRVDDQVREARERPRNTAVSDLLGDRRSSVGLGGAGAYAGLLPFLFASLCLPSLMPFSEVGTRSSRGFFGFFAFGAVTSPWLR